MSDDKLTKKERFNKKRIENLILRDPRMEERLNRKRTRLSELDSFQDMVQNKLKTGMGDLFSGVEKGALKKLLDTDKLKDVNKRILKKKGASPGRIKAEFGSEMADGGVVDLTTEMEVNE